MQNSKIKKIIFYSALALLITAVAYFLISDNGSTISKKLTSFLVKDTNKITKICITQNGKSLVLEKLNDNWLINNNTKVNSKKINKLLKTIETLKVSKPIALSLKTQTIKTLRKSVNVSIYKNNALLQSFFIGTIPQNKICIMAKNKNTPFQLSLLEMADNPMQYFSNNIKYWQSKLLINTDVNKITKIKIKNYNKPSQIFELDKKNDNYLIYNYLQNKKIAINKEIAEQYLKQLAQLKFYKYANNILQTTQDSIIKSTPIFVLTINYTNHKTQTIKAFAKPNSTQVNGFNQALTFDPDYFYIQTPNKQLVYAKYYDFSLVINPLNIFFK